MMQPNARALGTRGGTGQAPHRAQATIELDHHHGVGRFVGVARGRDVDRGPYDDPSIRGNLARL